jgi:hypothetical protein
MVLMSLLAVVSCRQESTDQSSTSREAVSKTVRSDSIVFRTSSEEYIYFGRRLYPSNSSDSMSQSVDQELVALEEVGDTIFAFLNSEKLRNMGNPKLPFATDSLLRYYYSKHYEVEIDDDIPYIAYLRSSRDYIRFTRTKKGDFYVSEAIIRDTVLDVMGEIRIGMSITKVLSELGIPLDIINKENFSLILCHVDIPSEIWYEQDVNLENSKTPQEQVTQLYLRFVNGQLELAFIDPWIGYGEKGSIPASS